MMLVRDPSEVRAPTTAVGPALATGERLIVAYKFIKAAVQVTLGLVLLVASQRSLDTAIVAFGQRLLEHAVHPWTAALARLLARVTKNTLVLASAGLLGDGLWSAFEAWALRRGYRWARWLVVFASASLLPVEVAALVRRVRVIRALVLIINLVIVIYLVTRIVGRARRPPEEAREATAS